MGVPVISILLAMVSWGQTYMENQAKRDFEVKWQNAQKTATEAKEETEVLSGQLHEIGQVLENTNESLENFKRQLDEMEQQPVPTTEYQPRIEQLSKEVEETKQNLERSYEQIQKQESGRFR